MRGLAAVALAVLLAASPAFAESDPAQETFDIQEAQYQDWRFLAHRDGPSSAWTCIAQTGDSYEMILGLEHRAGSVSGAPMVYYQQIETDERPEPVMGPGEAIGFGIDEDWLAGVVEPPRRFVLVDGWYVAHRAFPLNNERVLALMMAANTARVGRKGEPPIFAASLSGFTAAYRKMVEVCGVEKQGVAN